jgi:hypothetical protein
MPTHQGSAGGATVKQNQFDLYYTLQWQSQARKDAPYTNPRGSWLIFTGSQSLGPALAQYMEAHGESCILISPGQTYQGLKGEQWYWLNPAQVQDFQRLFQDVQGDNPPPCRGVLYLWGLEAEAPLEMSITDLESAQTFQLASLLHLIQALECTGWRDPPRLWVVTRGTQRIGPAPAEVTVAHSSLWAMARVAAEPAQIRLWVGMIDLDPTSPADEAELLFDEIWLPTGDVLIAFRQGQRYVTSLVVKDC